jgi:WD40 repeat protein
VNDSQRFLLEHFDTIQNFPSQIYHSALPLSPPSSWLHKHYIAELSGKVKVVKGFPAGWGTCSRTVKLNSNPQALACWKDTLAVGLDSGDILFLNAITGSQLAVLSGHTRGVTSLAFSPDGTSLVSGSYDETVKLWDVQTGGVVKTFCGHTDTVNSVSISTNYTMIASGSSDKTICLWKIQTGECHCVIKQVQEVDHVIFSPTDPQYLISASGGDIWMWDISGHQVGPTHEGTCAAFSPDGTHFITCQEAVSTIWTSDSRVAMTKCQIPNYDPNYPIVGSSFSPDGRLVATAAGDFVYIWDITSPSPLLVETFIDDLGYFTSLAFSSSSTLISAASCQSVRFWQIGGLSTDPVAAGPTPTPATPAVIRSVHLRAEDGIVAACDWDGVVRTWDLSTGLCKGPFEAPYRYHSLEDVQMVDGRLVSVWLGENKIYIWDADKDKPFQIVDVGWRSFNGLRISGDGSTVFCIIEHFLQAWSIQTGEAVGEVEVGGNLLKKCLHVDGSRVWVFFKDKPTQGWDFEVTGPSPVTISNSSSERPHPHPIYNILGMESHGSTWIEDTATGRVVFRFSGRYAEPTVAQCDGQYLVAGYGNGDVLILNIHDVHPQ